MLKQYIMLRKEPASSLKGQTSKTIEEQYDIHTSA